jgi:predicted NodU family carbamoyl transferase
MIGVRVLGLSGFVNRPGKLAFAHVGRAFFHNAAAALVVDGEVVAAAEEERFDRIKHSHFFPVRAARYCLAEGKVGLASLDRIAFFFAEDYVNSELLREAVADPAAPLSSASAQIAGILAEELGGPDMSGSLNFVPHHVAHAASAWSGRYAAEALVCVMDGNAETQGISLFAGSADGLSVIREYGRDQSLGHFYSKITEFLGFGRFDEYKVMGLAPYGDAARLRAAFDSATSLDSGGGYTVSPDACIKALVQQGVLPRRRGADINPEHKDTAAALQAALTRTALHVLRHARHATGLRRLYVSGGVAQNSALNGEIARSGIFDEVYVDPVAHDAGAALGAACYASGPGRRCVRSGGRGGHRLARPDADGFEYGCAYLGPDIGSEASLDRILRDWADLVTWSRPDDPNGAAASLLAAGQTVGCARGRAEFGPRALGNRSILADPRPPGMRDHVNQVIKLRESFRPLAPAVLAEAAADYFELPASRASLEYMGIVVWTRPRYRALLGAVTHVDGSARIQLVHAGQAPAFAALLERFRDRTGLPILLNTSFNNYAEPMVLTARDAIRCYLTSGLDHLLLGDYLVSRQASLPDRLVGLRVTIPPGTELTELHRSERAETYPEPGRPAWAGNKNRGPAAVICRNRYSGAASQISQETHELLRRALRARDAGTRVDASVPPAILLSLWEQRLIELWPR